jgi:hypothetical protein
MNDLLESVLDGALLLPNEQMTPDNISLLQQYSDTIISINLYMQAVRTAIYNYQTGYTSKIVLNPSEIQDYISLIRSITVRIGGGYEEDGITTIAPLATNILPDLLMNMRDAQLWLCRLYALYDDSQGSIVGPLDKVDVEDKQTGGGVV